MNFLTWRSGKLAGKTLKKKSTQNLEDESNRIEGRNLKNWILSRLISFNKRTVGLVTFLKLVLDSYARSTSTIFTEISFPQIRTALTG